MKFDASKVALNAHHMGLILIWLVVGDSALKFVCSAYLYVDQSWDVVPRHLPLGYNICLTYSHSSPRTVRFAASSNKNEDYLHNQRKMLVANRNLHLRSLELGLPSYLQVRDFAVKFWYPPALTVEKPAIMPPERELRWIDVGDKVCLDRPFEHRSA